MMNRNEDMDALLVKYLLGEATVEEAIAAKEWINSTDERRRHFAALKLIWNESRHSRAESTMNVDEAWDRFRQRTAQQPTGRQIAMPRSFSVQRAAAAVLLLICSAAAAFYTLRPGKQAQDSTAQSVKKTTTTDSNKQTVVTPAIVMADSDHKRSTETKEKRQPQLSNVIKLQEKAIPVKKHTRIEPDTYGSGQPICNSTPCPIEICISQTMKCPDVKPAEISSCSMIEPDQATRLSYKTHDKIARNCSLTTEEITITSIATGEAIILNGHSSPSTAQDLFKYISGEKKGDILAGVFHADCDNRNNERSLRFDNKSGNWTLQ